MTVTDDTLVVSALQLGWTHPSWPGGVGLVLIAFVAPLQIAASIFGFLAQDVVARTGMGIVAGTWLSVGILTVDQAVA